MTARATSTVIEFPLSRVRPAALREPGTCSAEVLIFSGVRFERLAEDPEAAPKTRSITRKGRGQRR